MRKHCFCLSVQNHPLMMSRQPVDNQNVNEDCRRATRLGSTDPQIGINRPDPRLQWRRRGFEHLKRRAEHTLWTAAAMAVGSRSAGALRFDLSSHWS